MSGVDAGQEVSWLLVADAKAVAKELTEWPNADSQLPVNFGRKAPSSGSDSHLR